MSDKKSKNAIIIIKENVFHKRNQNVFLKMNLVSLFHTSQPSDTQLPYQQLSDLLENPYSFTERFGKEDQLKVKNFFSKISENFEYTDTSRIKKFDEIREIFRKNSAPLISYCKSQLSNDGIEQIQAQMDDLNVVITLIENEPNQSRELVELTEKVANLFNFLMTVERINDLDSDLFVPPFPKQLSEQSLRKTVQYIAESRDHISSPLALGKLIHCFPHRQDFKREIFKSYSKYAVNFVKDKHSAQLLAECNPSEFLESKDLQLYLANFEVMKTAVQFDYRLARYCCDDIWTQEESDEILEIALKSNELKRRMIRHAIKLEDDENPPSNLKVLKQLLAQLDLKHTEHLSTSKEISPSSKSSEATTNSFQHQKANFEITEFLDNFEVMRDAALCDGTVIQFCRDDDWNQEQKQALYEVAAPHFELKSKIFRFVRDFDALKTMLIDPRKATLDIVKVNPMIIKDSEDLEYLLREFDMMLAAVKADWNLVEYCQGEAWTLSQCEIIHDAVLQHHDFDVGSAGQAFALHLFDEMYLQPKRRVFKLKRGRTNLQFLKELPKFPTWAKSYPMMCAMVQIDWQMIEHCKVKNWSTYERETIQRLAKEHLEYDAKCLEHGRILSNFSDQCNANEMSEEEI